MLARCGSFRRPGGATAGPMVSQRRPPADMHRASRIRSFATQWSVRSMTGRRNVYGRTMTKPPKSVEARYVDRNALHSLNHGGLPSVHHQISAHGLPSGADGPDAANWGVPCRGRSRRVSASSSKTCDRSRPPAQHEAAALAVQARCLAGRACRPTAQAEAAAESGLPQFIEAALDAWFECATAPPRAHPAPNLRPPRSKARANDQRVVRVASSACIHLGMANGPMHS